MPDAAVHHEHPRPAASVEASRHPTRARVFGTEDEASAYRDGLGIVTSGRRSKEGHEILEVFRRTVRVRVGIVHDRFTFPTDAEREAFLLGIAEATASMSSIEDGQRDR